jgi:glycosyltransferase involved in cell wall biosynthesis
MAKAASAASGAPPHLLHLFSTFTTGGSQTRTATILNRLGDEFRHTIVAMDGKFGAREKVDPGVACRYLPPPPRQSSWRYPLAMRRFVAGIAPDLALTYNWGAMDGFVGAATLPGLPVIHGEDGFGPDEVEQLLARRVWTRRIWLRRAHRVVVPSRTLERIALEQYKLPDARVAYIANGIDTRRFTPGKNAALRRDLGIAPDALVFGFIGRLGAEKNLGLLLRAFAAASLPSARLVMVGDGESAAELRRLAAELGVAETVLFTGAHPSTAEFYGVLDVFTMCSLTEQAPLSLLEAMGCGLPVLCTDVGDMREMLGNPGAPSVVASGDEASYTAAMRRIAEDAALRERHGAANRRRCLELFTVEGMIANYRALYSSGVAAGAGRV